MCDLIRIEDLPLLHRVINTIQRRVDLFHNKLLFSPSELKKFTFKVYVS